MTGIICINKSSGTTSFGVCAKVRGITGEKKCGHTGTLDPMATGVLPVMLGGATRFLDFLPESDKRYRASFILGKTTDTLDITGRVTAEYNVNAGAVEVKAALAAFRGKIMQVPPMYSAVSVNGERLYDLARKGIEVERPAREVEIKLLKLISAENGVYTIDVLCTKGTYIRTLIDDVGKMLGCGAVMTSLIRTEAMGFTIDDCISTEQLQQRKDSGAGFDDILIPADKALDFYDRITVSPAQSSRFKNGGALAADRIKYNMKAAQLYRVYSPEGVFLGLGEAAENELKAKRIFVNK